MRYWELFENEEMYNRVMRGIGKRQEISKEEMDTLLAAQVANEEHELEDEDHPVERAKVMRAVREGIADGVKESVETVEGELVFK